ncbi:hypothetical protein B0F90DRAFT_894670 [Multifurca ochricompacta]|uniref:Transmembrane protein n=1 Tax=Multifurca ochricompacta TaxID=376703 RepID=A0AAD4M0Z4_9AGAM|nr:hypothetical protein B0F90DRAFT_894670 [Multifurca ochricompacta]
MNLRGKPHSPFGVLLVIKNGCSRSSPSRVPQIANHLRCVRFPVTVTVNKSKRQKRAKPSRICFCFFFLRHDPCLTLRHGVISSISVCWAIALPLFLGPCETITRVCVSVSVCWGCWGCKKTKTKKKRREMIILPGLWAQDISFLSSLLFSSVVVVFVFVLPFFAKALESVIATLDVRAHPCTVSLTAPG